METKLTPKLDADLERRVAERTAQLAAANEQLSTELAERRRAEAQFRYQAQLLAAVKDAVIATDERLMIAFWNPAAAAVYGWKAGEVIGRPVMEVLQTEFDGATREAVLQAALETGEYRGEVRQRRKDGSLILIESTARVLRDANGRTTGWVGVNRDITERKQAEEAIRRQSLRVQVLADVSRTLAEMGLDYQRVLETVARRLAELIGDACVITLLSDDGQWLTPVACHHPNPKAVALMRDVLAAVPKRADTGPSGHVLQTGEPMLMPVVPQEQYRALIQPDYISYVEHFGIHSLLIVPLRAHGRTIGTLGLTRDQPGRPYSSGDQAFLQDLADRAALAIQNARLFQSLSEQREQLRALSTRRVEVQESERRRLAWEIHDDISQSLTALMMQLGAVLGRLPESDSQARKILEEAEALTKKTLEGVRRMIADLRPPALDDFGLIPALRRLGDELREHAGVDVAVEAVGLSDRLPPPLETALFRIVQEALTNIRKHAHARHASISLAVERERVMLLVKDDGVGLNFRRDQARRRGDVLISGGWVVPAGHYGLVGMQERAALLGGTLQVQSAPGEGTTLRVELPR